MIKYLISCALCFDPRADWGQRLEPIHTDALSLASNAKVAQKFPRSVRRKAGLAAGS